MPRIVFLGMFVLIATIPFLFFGALSQSSPSNYNDPSYHGGYYRRGPSFFFYNSGGRTTPRGRSFSSGGYKGGGFRAGK